MSTPSPAVGRSRVVALAVLVVSSCGAATMEAPGGSSGSGGLVQVEVVASTPSDCTFVGAVVGEAGGGMQRASASSGELVEYAMDDLRRRAAEMGATHVVPSEPVLGDGGTAPHGATVMGNAFVCESTEPP